MLCFFKLIIFLNNDQVNSNTLDNIIICKTASKNIVTYYKLNMVKYKAYVNRLKC